MSSLSPSVHPRKPADLAAHTCLNYLTRKWRFVSPSRRVEIIEPAGPISTISNEVLREMTRQGMGLVYSLPAFFADDVASGGVREVLSDYTRHSYIRIVRWHSAVGSLMQYWIYEPESGQLVESSELDRLVHVDAFDSDRQVVRDWRKPGPSQRQYRSFRWAAKRLELIRFEVTHSIDKHLSYRRVLERRAGRLVTVVETGRRAKQQYCAFIGRDSGQVLLGPKGHCVASANGCRDSAWCKSDGTCALRNDSCVVSAAGCRNSQACREGRACGFDGRRCVDGPAN